MALFARKNKNSTSDSTTNGTTAPATDTSVASSIDASSLSSNDDALSQASARRKGKKKSTPAVLGLKGGAVVGLNIGNETIRAVEMRGKGTDVAVTALGSIPTPPGCIANGIILNPVSLASALRDLFAQNSIKTRDVITSISASGSLVVRVLEVPRMSDAELTENINTDLERYIPFPPNEVVKDFHALRQLPSDPDSPNMEVLLAAAQNEVVDQHLQVLRDAKIEPQSIDVEPLAASRAVLHDGPSNGGETFVDYNSATAVVNIGATTTEISVLRGDVLVFTRAVPVAGNSITQALADTLGLAWPDAEQLKLDMGDALPPHNAAAASQNTEDWSEFGEPNDSTAKSSAEADPFSSDFFEKGPGGNDPQQQHQQKQGGDAPESRGEEKQSEAGRGERASAFDLSRFNFSEDEVVVDEGIPTVPEDEASVSVAGDAAPLKSEEDETAGLPAISNEPQNVTSSTQTESVDPDDTSSLPGVLDFPMAGEDDTLSAMAPSGQMYGMNSVDDPDLISFPTLPVGLMAAGQENASFEDEDSLPTLVEEDAITSVGEPNLAASVDATSPALTSAGAPASAPTSSSAPASAPEPVESDSVESVFDFSTTSEATGTVDDFDTAFADMIGDTGPAPSVVTAPPVAPSAFAMDPAIVPTESDFDLDQFAVSGSADDTFGADDFGFGLGDSGTITPAKVYEVLQPRLAELLGEVRRSLEYFSSRYPDSPVQRIALVGGGARLANIDALFAQEIGIPTAIDRPLSRLTVRVANLPSDFIEQQGAAYAVATGLALRDVVS